MSLILIIVLLILLFGGGGYWGHSRGYYGNGGFSLIGILLLVIVLWLLFGGGYVHAQTPVGPRSDTTVTGAPWYKMAEPYLMAAWTTITAGVLTWIGTILKARFNVQLTDSDKAAIQTASTNAAGRLLAAGEAPSAAIRMDVLNPAVAAEVAHIQSVLGDELQRTGMTPDRVAKLICGKVGLVQAGVNPAGTIVSH